MLDSIPITADIAEVRDKIRLYRWSQFNNPDIWAAAGGDNESTINELQWFKNVMNTFGSTLY
eukprot:506735-Pyramimonas_sp.AAC.1